MKNKWKKSLLALLLIFSVASCSNRQQEQSSVQNSSLPSPMESASQKESLSEIPQNNLFSVVLESGANDMTGFYYYGNQPYAQMYNGGVMPKLSVSPELFSCRKRSSEPYASEEDAFMDELAAGLSNVAVDPDTKTFMQEGYPLPDTEDYMGFWLSLGDWNPCTIPFLAWKGFGMKTVSMAIFRLIQSKASLPGILP